MQLNGAISTCQNPKTLCPGVFGDTGVYYRSYTFTNESTSSECITVMMEVNCSSQLFCAAYIDSFNSGNVCQNYLADPGLCIANGGTDSMSFTVAAGAKYCLVVSAVVSGNTCNSFTLKVSQFATSWQESIVETDLLMAQRLHLDGIKYSCETPKPLCSVSPALGLVYHDSYLYKNTTPNDICVRVKLYQQCRDSNNMITSAAYLNSYDSTNVCLNVAADAGVAIANKDSLWYSFIAPAASNYWIVVYAQNDSLLCDDYKVKVEAAYTTDIESIQIETDDIFIHPNPVERGNPLSINYNPKVYERLEFFELTGKLLFTLPLLRNQQSIKLPTSFLTQGFYLIKLSGEKNSTVQKMIVK